MAPDLKIKKSVHDMPQEKYPNPFPLEKKIDMEKIWLVLLDGMGYFPFIYHHLFVFFI